MMIKIFKTKTRLKKEHIYIKMNNLKLIIMKEQNL